MNDNTKRRLENSEIRELLELNSWRYQDLADRIGVHVMTVQKWLDGNRNPSSAAQILMKQWLDEARKSVPA